MGGPAPALAGESVVEGCKFKDSYTYVQRDGTHAPMSETDELRELPGCIEVMAPAWHWDPFGLSMGTRIALAKSRPKRAKAEARSEGTR